MNTSELKGEDFEFILTPGDIKIDAEDFDRIMTPESFQWSKIIKEDWVHYQVGADDFSYSWEMPGIVMTFNDEITYAKAKAIADEVVAKLSKYCGQEIELTVISSGEISSFD